MGTHDAYTPERSDRWNVAPMVTMRYQNIAFNTDGNLCHFYKQPTMWLNPCHFANKGCKEGNNCRFAYCDQEIQIATTLLKNWAHQYRHEAGALIRVYREALRVVNSINPNTPSRRRPDVEWLNMNPHCKPALQPSLAVNDGALPKAIPSIPPLALTNTSPPIQALPEDEDATAMPIE